MANVCEICYKTLKNRKAYAGHMWLAHQKRVGAMAEIDAMLLQVNEKLLQFNQMDKRISVLEAMLCAATGIRIDDAQFKRECERRGIKLK